MKSEAGNQGLHAADDQTDDDPDQREGDNHAEQGQQTEIKDPKSRYHHCFNTNGKGSNSKRADESGHRKYKADNFLKHLDFHLLISSILE